MDDYTPHKPDANYSTITQVLNSQRDKLNQKLEKFITEGLRKKGYAFDNQYELIEFIKNHCYMTFDNNTRDRMYYVDNVLFMKWTYKPKYEQKETDRSVCYRRVLGYIEYL